jgi:protease-4
MYGPHHHHLNIHKIKPNLILRNITHRSMARNKKDEPGKLIIGLILLLVAAFVVVIFFISVALTAFDFGPEGKVAVIQIHDTIGSRDADLDTILNLLEEARDNPKIGAVVLDINSPGGLPVATREIGEKVKQVKQKKPVVAWIGESGTSGAYWVATTSDWVMADPLSIVGSIGVILEVPNISGLMEKIGVQITTIKGGDYKDMGSPFRNMTDEERAILEDISRQLHQEFVNEVSENRGLYLNVTQELADGQVYLGRKALELGLIDELGTRDDAIEKAAELANIEPNWFYLQEEGFGPLLREIAPEQPFWMP